MQGRMKAPRFSYTRAQSVDDVLDLLGRHGDEARILAGGQSLMPTLNMRLSQPRLLIDINRIEDLKGIALEGDRVRIGAMARHAEVARSEIVAQHLPLIAQAMPHVAHVAVRNRGTFGGSIALADPAAEMPACAVALGATFVLQSVAGRREVAAEDFFRGLYETARRPDELLVEALIPVERPGTVSVFLELARRHGDFALAGIAARFALDRDRVADARLVYFGSEDRPRSALRAASHVIGKPAGAVIADEVVAALAQDLSPISNAQGSARLRLELQRVLTKRALGLTFSRRRAA
jgi:aerobic carbon-monoxide dehydrogenase medium subunit